MVSKLGWGSQMARLDLMGYGVMLLRLRRLDFGGRLLLLLRFVGASLQRAVREHLLARLQGARQTILGPSHQATPW